MIQSKTKKKTSTFSSTRRKKATFNEAQILLKLNDLQQSERIFSAWSFAQLDFKADSWDDFLQRYPKGSKGFDAFYAVGHFLELAGVLLKYGALNEDLFFETFWFGPIWKNFEPLIKSMRRKFNEPSLEENFEYLYNRYLAWKKKKSGG